MWPEVVRNLSKGQSSTVTNNILLSEHKSISTKDKSAHAFSSSKFSKILRDQKHQQMEIVIASLALVVVLWCIWRILEWVWLKPKMLESYLRRQGLVGTRYTPLVGDVRRSFSMLKEARSKPMKPTDDLISLVMPYSFHMLNTYG